MTPGKGNSSTTVSDVQEKGSLLSLMSEPSRLRDEATRLNNELESLVMENYRVFIENLTCSINLKKQDKKLGDISKDLENNLNDLSQQCVAFKDRVSQFVSSHKRNRKTLQHHLQLVELLEVPQLVDACARNGFHDEAIELANFVNGLERRHLLAFEVKEKSSNNPNKLRSGSGVVLSIVDEVHRTLGGLRQQLLHSLTENTSLPKEIQILATLRKLDGLLIDRFLSVSRHDNEVMASLTDKQREQLRSQLVQSSETRLQMDFLETRTIWLSRNADKTVGTASTKTSSSSSSSLGPYGQVIETLEMKRTAWFAVITQFNALFLQQDRLATTVLSAWATRQTSGLVHELRLLLPQIDEGASLRSVLEQSLFFSSRMSQVGCDFSFLLMPLFSDVSLDKFQRDTGKVCEHFKTMVSKEKISFDNDEEESVVEQIIPLYSSQETPNSSDVKLSPATEEFPAPTSLLRFPPLSYLLNGLLSALNFLRECPLLTIKENVYNLVDSLLRDLTSFVIQNSVEIRKNGEKYFGDGFMREIGKKGKSNSSEFMDCLYAKVLANELFPHLLVCLESIWQGATLLDKVKKQRQLKSEAFLIGTIVEGKEVLGTSVFDRLERTCWTPLIRGGLLKMVSEPVAPAPLQSSTTDSNSDGNDKKRIGNTKKD